eukprot:Blabericola_migrator_1__593@NODE_1145_length_5293_cov_76_243781_g779_i0_p1_GENE_NODE_1145_length_5293_cov_76_243781_g779_i0NODE_1145_length_5293_cov_76_243781_g779_i0_p1_ORF_typecomplete_len834_score128_03cEGF/PF12662_7/1_7e04cEGF/PF12662_7/1_6e03cEGF/PF12662_7/4_6e03cEGF/PF12662_7/1_7e03cEGF/PF12662_7/50cEGF/PF12662_7/8_7e03cEGF/PF12662_7/1_9cEGF/PF12662_7/38cEGF/PF12662_7/1_2e03_NODE_1145_length_5293_cov_76_243781_g779_i014573958
MFAHLFFTLGILIPASCESDVEELFGSAAIARSLIGAKYLGTPNTGPQWVDYPAFALSMPPGAPVLGSQESVGGGKRKGKNNSLPPAAVPRPLFDIVVEPEYIPDPFPVPYPYPIEQRPGMLVSGMPSAPQMPEERNNAPRRPRYKRQQYIERAEPDWKCPGDYIQEGANCVKIDQIEVDVGCPEGWKYDGNVCRAVDVIPPDAVCDAGYIPWETKSECVKEVTAPREMLCPVGFLGTEHGCKKNIETAAVAICQDADYVHGMCRRPTRATPLATCPVDFAPWDDPHFCFRESLVEGEIICPTPLHRLVHGVCEKHTTGPPNTVCPQSFHLVGNECIREVVESASVTCESGVLREDGACLINTDNVIPDLACHDGFSLNMVDHKCEQLANADPIITCPVGYVYLLEKAHCIPTKTKGKGQAPWLPAIVECPVDTLLTANQRCQGTLEHEPLYICQPPYLMVDGLCRKDLIQDPLLICPIGSELKDGACAHLESVQPNLLCMPGYALTPDGVCELVEVTDPAIRCPPGFSNSLTNAACQRVEKLDATLQCPPLMSLIVEGGRHVCAGEEVFEPEFACTVDGMMLEFAPSGPTCKGIHVEPPTYVCPTAFKDEPRGCVKYDVTPKRALCPEEYTFSFDVCVKEINQPPVLLCPTGYSHHQPSETCIRERYTDLLPICPSDMEFDRLVGECYKLKVEYEFDEPAKPPEEAQKDLSSPPPPEEAQKDLDSPPPPNPPPPPPPAPAPPPPQLTVIQQPVVIPQPAVILPQQAPVPPPPAIRVPYGVPQAIPTPVQPKHQHVVQHVHHQTDVFMPPPPQPPPPPMMPPPVIATGRKKHL